MEEYLVHCANLRYVPKNDVNKAVDEVTVRCGISHFKKRLIRNLSGGYQQRLGIAQAIIHNPDFVVFDEPTNGLDPNQIVEIRHLIKEIAQERTVILSTHILTEVQATCDHIYMIEQGTEFPASLSPGKPRNRGITPYPRNHGSRRVGRLPLPTEIQQHARNCRTHRRNKRCQRLAPERDQPGKEFHGLRVRRII